MTRKAIIICSPGGKRGLEFFRGVSLNTDNYSHFLSSKAGGQWKDEEILLLRDPDSEIVINSLENCKADYCFISFSGCGVITSFAKSDYLCLKDIDFPIAGLKSKSEKQTIIVDVCSQTKKRLTSLNIETVSANACRLIEGRQTRDIFDDAISKTPKGIIFIYSKGPTEIAGFDVNIGGHFTYSLLKAGLNWWENSGNEGILRLDSAVQKATSILNETFHTTQEPIMGGQIRRLTFPPFAVSKQ